MREFTSIASLRKWLASERAAGRRIGLVPTMGYLHAGHLSLVELAWRDSDVVVMSMFVNPLQFAPGEDFERYPRDPARDRQLASAAGVTAMFAPDVAEMYPSTTEVRIVAGATAQRWEGAVRPGHFDGVLTVVAKLFNIVQPDVAVFGQKDIQQLTLVRRMIRDLDFPVRLIVGPIVREPDGLAMSSRNVYLTPAARAAALALSRALARVEARWRAGEDDSSVLREVAASVFDAEPEVTSDYIAIVDPGELAPIDRVAAGSIVAVAARVGVTRLVDNVILGGNDAARSR